MFSKLFEIYLLLTPDREHGKFFKKVSITGFRRAKSLEVFLVRANVATLEKKKGCCRLCGSARYKMYNNVMTTETFRSFSTQGEYCIKPDNLNHCSWNVCSACFCHAKQVQNNKQVALKVFNLDSTIRSQPIVTSSVRRCSVQKVFLEILQNSQKLTCARVSFLIKLQTLDLKFY